jgi:Domain of unknown function (DUF4331)
MRFRKLALTTAATTVALAATMMSLGRVSASDHADTAENFNRIGADLTDVFMFPNPTDPSRVVLVMDSHGLIPAGQGGNVVFDPNVLYQFKIDNTGDFVEDLVIQFRFRGTGKNQEVFVSGPHRPLVTGTVSLFGTPREHVGTINHPFQLAGGIEVFAGVRSEPFFFDLNRFFAAFPDRMTPLTGQQVNFPSIMAANTPQVSGFRPPGQAKDFLIDLNVMSIVVELPKAMLGQGLIRLWETTSLPVDQAAGLFTQQDRLARPVVNEVLATVTDRRHEVNNKDNPTDDHGQLFNDIEIYLTFPAGRSPAIRTVIKSVLVPDVMTADLSQNVTKASYLGVETAGATGSKFGGRALTDDVVDTSLGIIFGRTVPALGLAPDDGNEIPSFTTDNIGPHTDFLPAFPYLGNPH